MRLFVRPNGCALSPVTTLILHISLLEQHLDVALIVSATSGGIASLNTCIGNDWTYLVVTMEIRDRTLAYPAVVVAHH